MVKEIGRKKHVTGSLFMIHAHGLTPVKRIMVHAMETTLQKRCTARKWMVPESDLPEAVCPLVNRHVSTSALMITVSSEGIKGRFYMERVKQIIIF